ncbi:hypothetical protein BDV10DRAFT_180066 [Aspergillus recurvatus]
MRLLLKQLSHREILVVSVVVAPSGPGANHGAGKETGIRVSHLSEPLYGSLKTTKQEAESWEVMLENGLSLAQMSR